MLNWLIRARLISAIMVVAMMVGALLMIGIGAYYTWEAVALLLGRGHALAGASTTLSAKLALLEAIDSFLFALVLFYFGYGTYFLVVNPESVDAQHPLPAWLQVKNIGQMKKTLLEVIVVLLAVVFLQAGFADEAEPDWSILVYPISIVALAISLKLISFDH